MKKATKKKSLWDHKVEFIVDEDLNKLKAELLAPKKLELANQHLRRIKNLPK